MKKQLIIITICEIEIKCNGIDPVCSAFDACLFVNRYFNLNTYKSDRVIKAFEGVFSKYYHRTQDLFF